MSQTTRKTASKITKKAKTGASPSEGFSAAERDAMKERARELKAEKSRADGEADVLAKVAEMDASDRAMATRLHAIVKSVAPGLMPKTWYGMPAYANTDGKIICFFKDAKKFGDRYATLGFNDAAMLDDGVMWPTSYGLKDLGDAEEKKIRALVKKAVA
ncbi:iron chaperone [Solilutibacter silvestris]|uniref:Uncharacterized protein n=1 Tax=Solilutibacter silvestris TaxID=1645665 RepID=A0A2K1PZT6_9GAMM|nr:DUF1801 domain-containing protein [Lysobacter silvestris]PNS08308.1 hypothetical protein Lysil_2484 [Lysobacter silvestris]